MPIGWCPCPDTISIPFHTRFCISIKCRVLTTQPYALCFVVTGIGEVAVKVAVIDNDHDLLSLMRELLEAQGLKPIVAASMAEARKVVHQEHPSLILLDLWLDTPESGWDLLREIKADQETVSIPVIVVSGGGHLLGERAKWLEEQGARILVKPFDLDEFDRAVEESLPGH